MSDWDEKAEDYAVAHHTYEYLTPDENAYYTSGFVGGARWQRESLLSEESIERAARAVAELGHGEDWPTNAEMGGGPTGTRDDEYRSECVRAARAALAAALGEDESNE